MEPYDWACFLRDALDERGWHQAELSRRSGVDDALISKWLSGQVRPGLAKIRSVCVALGVPPVQGMIASGDLQSEDVGATVVIRPRTTGPSDLTDKELLAELARRLNTAMADSHLPGGTERS